MTRKFSELRSKMSQESQKRAKSRTAEILGELSLADLRRARELTQRQLAEEMKVNQAWISKVERQTDMYLSTLRAYIEAIGGRLEVNARFGDQCVQINDLKDLENPRPSTPVHHQVSAGSRTSEIKVAVYNPPDPSYHGIELWPAGAATNTGRSQTPNTITTSATSQAA